MKVLSYCALVALVVVGLFLAGCGNKAIDTSKGATNQDSAVKALQLLSKSKMEEAAKVLGADPNMVKAVWLNLTGTMGPVQRISKAKSVKNDSSEVVIVNLHFGKGAVNAQMTFNAERNVTRFEFLPALAE